MRGKTGHDPSRCSSEFPKFGLHTQMPQGSGRGMPRGKNKSSMQPLCFNPDPRKLLLLTVHIGSVEQLGPSRAWTLPSPWGNPANQPRLILSHGHVRRGSILCKTVWVHLILSLSHTHTHTYLIPCHTNTHTPDSISLSHTHTHTWFYHTRTYLIPSHTDTHTRTPDSISLSHTHTCLYQRDISICLSPLMLL